MNKTLLIFYLVFKTLYVIAQEPPMDAEQQLENLTAGQDDVETEDDSYLQDMAHYLKQPLNLNTAGREELALLKILSPLQIESLIRYRQLLGKLIDKYEMQAIPLWDLSTIRQLLPYVSVDDDKNVLNRINEWRKGGDQSLLLRASQVMEKQVGFLKDSSSNHYLGSPQRILARYRFNYKNQLQYGIIAEKDAGEKFFSGSQKKGFDFYSVHFFVRNTGFVRTIALGDFVANFGQGLTQWMSLAFKKGPGILSIKRQAPTLRPYSSAGEANFFRGGGITVGKDNWQGTFFASYKKVDANLGMDSTEADNQYISSISVSGFHRTASEIAGKGSQAQWSVGSNFKIDFKGLQLGLNGVHHQLKHPLQKRPHPYNNFALNGKSFGNYSIDYSFTHRNFHLFGEAATTENGFKAFVSGMMISVAGNADMSFFYRNISKGYNGLYTSAFTENSFPNNEKGLFTGIALKPASGFTISLYADFFTFPWLKYRVDAPSTGSEYMAQLNYKPNKVFEFYTRFRKETKSNNHLIEGNVTNAVIPVHRKNWRTQFSYKLNSAFTLRSRAEIVWYNKKMDGEENGFAIFSDLLYKPMMKKMSGNIRLAYFETGGYNSRIYAYENDVQFSYSIPVLYGKGYRYYLNLNYDLNKKMAFWARIAQTAYTDRDMIGTGLDRIYGRHKTEIKLQGLYRF